MYKHFTVAVDADGIALITMDSPGRSMNVLGPEVEAELAAIVEQVVTDVGIRGAIITSGKPSFLAGYDLTVPAQLRPAAHAGAGVREFQAWAACCAGSSTCGKPFVAAINGLALGGGFEVASRVITG
jgi:3-hydroxyacyl-CoA dehydrogenase/enoyl-CoA hydratase/3-hydroxybutyryl-CoA epimerase